MSDKSEQLDKILDPQGIKTTGEKWDDLKVRDQIGISVSVERDVAVSDATNRANRALNDIGDYIHTNEPKIRDLEYCGSAAVHIYLAPTLNQVVYITQVQPLLNTHERLAGPAFTQLQKDMMASYGRKTTKVRSGF